MFLLFFCRSLVHLKERDDRIKESLTEKQQLFAALYKRVTGQETPYDGLHLVRGANDLQQWETLLNTAIDEGEGDKSSVCSVTERELDSVLLWFPVVLCGVSGKTAMFLS